MDDDIRPRARLWWIEARGLAALAGPLVAGNLAWVAIAATDLLLLSRLGPDAVAAGALALNLYNALLVAGMGLAAAAAPLIAAERGRRRHAVRDIRRTVRQTIWACLSFCLPCWAVLWQGRAILRLFGQDPALAGDAASLLHGLQWALPPYLCFVVLRNYTAALERPIWGVVVIAAAIPVNLLAGWALIFGHFGAPPLGLFGAGLAGTISALFMLLAMMAVVARDRHFRRYRLFGRWWAADRARLATVWRIGLPIAVTSTLEVSVFAAAAFLMGLIDRASLAAHAIAIQIATLTFMVPMGIGQAATVRVGLAYGRRDAAAIGRAGWIALIVGTGFAILSALVLIGAPRWLVSAFLDLADPRNAPVVAITVSFLAVAALFQLVDSAQVIGQGALRGLRDTRVPMVFAAVGYWVIGIGIGAILAFPLGWRGLGVWLGLASGLGVVAILLVWRWARRAALGLIPDGEE